MTFQFRCHETDEFRRQFQKLGASIQKRIDKAIREILFQNPYASKPLKQNLRGKRSLRVGDFRIVFAICEECRQLNYVALNGCKDCKKHGRNDVILFTCGHRGEVYD